MVQYRICSLVTLGLLTILLRFRTSICRYWLVVMYQPRSSVYATKITLGLIINAGMLLASSRRLIFGGPVIAFALTGKSLYAVRWELVQTTRRPSVSLVSETAMFVWLPSPVISRGDCCVRLEFVIATACWWGWWTGVRVGWYGSSTVRSFWLQAVQGVCWSSAYLPSIY